MNRYRNLLGLNSLFKSSLGFIVLFLLITTYSFADGDDNPFFHSTNNNTIPRSALVTSVSSPEPLSNSNSVSAEEDIWTSIRQNLALKDQYERPEVYKWIYWLRSHPLILKQVFLNARPYIYYIFQQTQNYQMPAEFALLPVIESAYDPYAFSKTGAVGIWQMMPGTAMIYGLDINWWYDGRRDVITSTDRALSFLVSLKKTLGDWLLAAAAYDAGAETIQKAAAINPSQYYQGSSFWRLALSQETEDYVPKLLAIAALVSDPEKYGITLPFIPNKEYFSAIKLDFQIDQGEIAKMAQVSTQEIKKLNPGMRRFATDPGKTYTLLLPVENAGIFKENLARVAGKNHVSWQYHEVHEGQTLESIAQNYHTTMELLRSVNKMNLYDQVFAGEGLVVPLYLHRKFIDLQGDVAPETKAILSDAVNKITANDILSGNLPAVENNTLDATNNPEVMAQNQEVPNEALTHQANELSARNNEAPQTAPQEQGISSEPIHEQDNLHTILNKLYSSG